MYDMEDGNDKNCKKSPKTCLKPSSLSLYTDPIYPQSHSLTSTSSDNPLLSTLQCVEQCPSSTFRTIRTSGQSLSAQVREYYQKYSRSNLDQYFSLPGASFDDCTYQYQRQMSNAIDNDESFLSKKVGKNSTEISRRRRKWERPMDIIGQSSVVSNSQIFSHHHLITTTAAATSTSATTTTDIQTSSVEEINKYPVMLESHEFHKTKNNSPTSSVTSNRLLEWDNGADLGYDNLSGDLLTHENCPALLRLDPEGRTCPNLDTTSGINSGNRISKLHSSNLQCKSKPNAHSTQTFDDDETIEFSGNIQITPITKSHFSGVIAGHVSEDNEDSLKGALIPETPSSKNTETATVNDYIDTPKSSLPIESNNFKSPTRKQNNNDHDDNLDNTLKKSASMNVLPLSIVPLTMRSQSDINLHAFNNNQNRGNHPINFYSTSSITTIVTKPLTCDKDIQTNIIVNSNKIVQSKGIQVSEILNVENNNNNETIKNDEIKKEEVNDKQAKNEGVLPKKVNNIVGKIMSNIPIVSNLESENNLESISQMRNDSAQTISEYDETDDGGRASNSFEYFPGDIYQNASTNNGNADVGTSRVSSSMETRISHSTMPNTSSSFDEKLWGDSDTLLRDLERSLYVLKSLVDANKCDKQVKKRLIHHVIKRLVTAKYTDDKIEHDLADNVPWNPDDTRTKVYRTEIIQALANKQKQQQQQNSTVDTDDEENEAEETEEWKVTRIKSSSCGKRVQNSGSRERRKIIDLVMSTENSDIFEERNTDRTDAMQDGRKARMGLRNDDKHRHHHHHHHQRHHHQQRHRKNLIDMDKSESSECFLPQSQGLNYKGTKTINNKPIITIVTSKSQTSSATPNTTTSSRDMSSQYEINDERKQQRNEKIDWRLPTTISERRFDYERSTSRLGTATRLIDYVEMEKKNQLVWINSEINHLSNLKKLLEESKNYENIDKKNLSRKTTSNCDKRSDNSTPTSFNLRTIDKQWSSHGNIAERCDKTCNNNISTKTVFTKRNSCTQTAATNVNNGLSRCDPTEISSTTGDFTSRDTSNVRVQTYSPMPQSSRGTSPWSPRRYCRKHSNKRNSCRCQRPTSLSPRRGHDQLLDDRRVIASQSAINSNKDAKNLLNDQCKSEFNDITENQNKHAHVNRQRRACCCGNTNISPTFCKNNITKLSNDSARCDSRDEQKDKFNDNNKQNEKSSQEVKSCRVCGTIYSNDDRQCQCKMTYMKPIAYELSFEDAKKVPTAEIKKPRGKLSTATMTVATHESCKTSSCSCSSSTQPRLKDYLEKNRPEFVDNVEMRKRYMTEITQLRQLKKEKRKQLLAMASPNSFIIPQKTIRRSTKSPRKISDDEMKMRLRMRYLRLNEVRNKRRQREKEEQTRRNHLMAKIFCKKLQQKVLEGQVDVSQSVSVISNL